MSTHKHIDRFCVVVTVFAVIISMLLMNAESLGISVRASAVGYETRLFDTSRVHTIDIVMDDWDSFISTAQSEEYSSCAVVIDGEAYKNVGIRGKGNTSLSNVASMNSERYSFKIEFDKYDNTKTYYGLDKLCLNNIIQDNTYMKDYLTYRMMSEFGVNAPLCSFVYITVNGEDWGLYLAVEGIEEGFLERNYGGSYGELYKPDSMSFGGGRGNGKDFNFDDIKDKFSEFSENSDNNFDNVNFDDIKNKFSDFAENAENNGDFSPEDIKNFAEDTLKEQGISLPDFSGMPEMSNNNGGFGGGGMGSDDVKLQYIDDNADSYSNIFDNAKTDVTDEDKERLISSLKKLSEYSDIESVVNIDEVIRYFVVHNFVCNGDSYTGSMIHNYYLYEKDGQLSMLPWDYNLAFGTFQGGNAQSQVNSAIDLDLSDRPMANWIFESEEYTALYHQYFSEFLDSVDISAIIDEAYALISIYVEKDPTKFCTYDEYEKGVETLRTFCELRTESVRGQLDGSIPSTSSGQSADSSAFIDASSITLSDMGTMNNGGGMGGGNGGFGGKRNRSGDSIEQSDLINTSVDVSSDSFSEAQPPEIAQGDMQPPEMPNGEAPSGDMQPPEMPNGEAPSGNMQPPEMPNGEMPSGFSGETTPVETAAPVSEEETEMSAVSDENTEPETSVTDNSTAEPAASETNAENNTENETATETGAAAPETNVQGGNRDDFKNRSDSEREMPGSNNAPLPQNSNSDGSAPYILFGISIVVLAAGIVFAVKFKR